MKDESQKYWTKEFSVQKYKKYTLTVKSVRRCQVGQTDTPDVWIGSKDRGMYVNTTFKRFYNFVFFSNEMESVRWGPFISKYLGNKGILRQFFFFEKSYVHTLTLSIVICN